MGKIENIFFNGEKYNVGSLIESTNSVKINYDYDNIFSEMIKRFSVKPTIEHKCNNCGATLIINNDKHIFKCDFCGACYAIGTQMIAAE